MLKAHLFIHIGDVILDAGMRVGAAYTSSSAVYKVFHISDRCKLKKNVLKGVSCKKIAIYPKSSVLHVLQFLPCALVMESNTRNGKDYMAIISFQTVPLPNCPLC